MELLYVYIDDHLGIKKCGFNFSDRFHISETTGDDLLNIKVNFNEQHLTDYFHQRYLNVTAIIGRNGAGKSNLMNFLTRLLTNSTMKIHYGLKFAAVFENAGRIECYHTLFDTQHRDMETIYENEWDVSMTTDNMDQQVFSTQRIEIHTNIHDDPTDVIVPGLNTSNTIYYNPLFDLRDIPTRFSFEYKEEIDVSTNSLLEKDNDDLKTDKYSQIEKHKLRNTERQFDTIFNPQIDFSEINLPIDIEINFTRVSVNERNLNPRSNRVFTTLTGLLASSFHLVTTGDRFDQAKGHLKATFLDCLIFHFFDALAHHEQWQAQLLNLPEGTFESPPQVHEVDELYQYILSFFMAQQFIDADFMQGMIATIWHTIDHPGTERRTTDDGVYFVSRENALEIWAIQSNYLEEIGVQYPFINLSWRNISSGEKAFLDMYSRLNYAHSLLMEKRRSLTPQQREQWRTLYILIDEGEAGFHPLWQQEYFARLQSYIVQLFANIPVNIQLFITSHSPFLLSDLPATNILLLDKIGGVVSADGNLDETRQTMGANILALFDDTFFLPKGTIGEYAREKINDFIETLNSSDQQLKLEEGESFISAIGDPFLRAALHDQMENRRSLDDTIDELQNELTRLMKLKDDQNNKK